MRAANTGVVNGSSYWASFTCGATSPFYACKTNSATHGGKGAFRCQATVMVVGRCSHQRMTPTPPPTVAATVSSSASAFGFSARAQVPARPPVRPTARAQGGAFHEPKRYARPRPTRRPRRPATVDLPSPSFMGQGPPAEKARGPRRSCQDGRNGAEMARIWAKAQPNRSRFDIVTAHEQGSLRGRGEGWRRQVRRRSAAVPVLHRQEAAVRGHRRRRVARHADPSLRRLRPGCRPGAVRERRSDPDGGG